MHAAKAAIAAWKSIWQPPVFQPLISPQNLATLKAGLWLSVLTISAFSLALFTAFEAGINEAGLSGMTAAVLALPATGAPFAKSFARIAGCAMSVVACVGLFWMFPQAPWLFAAGLSLWIGFCAFWGSRVKYFTSYAFILAGWSAGIIATDTHNPEFAMVIAGERVSVFIIGILAVMFVFGIAHIRKGFAAYLPPLREMNDKIVSQIKGLIANPESYDNTAAMTLWAKRIESMHQSLEYAGAEDPEVALHAKSIRCGLNVMFADLSDFMVRLQQLRLLLRASPDQTIANQVDQSILDAFDARLRETDAQAIKRTQAMQAMVLKYFSDQSEPNILDQTRLLAEIDAAGKLINSMNLVRRGRETCIEENVRPLGLATTFSDSFYSASVAALTFLLAYSIYIVNEWQIAGQQFIVLVSIFILLAGVTDSPVAKIMKIIPGALGGFAAALICQQVLLPLGSGFPWLVLCFAVTILIPGSILRMFPKTTEPANAFIQVGMILAMPQNLMHYDLQTFLNNGLACASSLVLVLGCMMIFFPGGLIKRIANIKRQAVHDMLQTPWHLEANRFSSWEDRQLERLSIVNNFPQPKGSNAQGDTTYQLLIMVRLARCFKRQHDDLNNITLSPPVDATLRKASWFWSRQFSSPDRFRVVTERAVEALVNESAIQPVHSLVLQAAAHEWRMILKNSPLVNQPSC